MNDAPRHLVLVRHATAESGGDVPDADRALTDAGLEEAQRLGQWLKKQGLLGEVTLCSPAKRTRQTWAAIGEATGHGVMIDMEPAIYEADVDTLLEVVRGIGEDVRTAVLVGHAPGMPQLAADLTNGAGEANALAELNEGFPPASVAVVALEVPFADVARGMGELQVVRHGTAD